MTITNKKLLKNFKTILASSISAKEILTSELDKIDEKYRKLAEAEKSDITEQMAILDDQIKLYSAFLTDTTQENAAEEATSVEEDVVVDTVFPENNVEEEETEEATPEGESEGSSEEGDIVWPEDEAEEQEETAEPEGETAEDDGWPSEPQEW